MVLNGLEIQQFRFVMGEAISLVNNGDFNNMEAETPLIFQALNPQTEKAGPALLGQSDWSLLPREFGV